jgi:hypothetical protein
MGNKEYLGDGVFVDIEDGMIKLTTEDGIKATNTIYLEVEVLEAFRRWCDHTLIPKPEE